MRTNRSEKRVSRARRAANKATARADSVAGPDFLKAQLLSLCGRIERAAARLRDCDLDADEAGLHEVVRDLGETAMRVQTIEDALEVRAKLKAAYLDLELLSVKDDDADDCETRVMRPMIAEARRGLAAVRA